MKNQVLVKRYCQGLLGSVRGEQEFNSLLPELTAFSELLTRDKLSALLLSPFVSGTRRQKIAQKILSAMSLHPKSVRFLLLLLENERFELLPDIIASLPDMWNEASGISSIEVLSVVPLSETQKQILQQKLEKIEQRPVALKFQEDPSLIGGLALRKGNIVYDVSVKGSLESLREKIIEG